ncbi:MAG: hypothetical protein ACKVU2_09470 [Saprospiraceae bacterium]
MKQILFAVLLAAIGSGIFYYFSTKTRYADSADYEVYLNASHLEKAKQGHTGTIHFWENKLREQPDNFVYQSKIAGQYAAWFRLTGDVDKLRQSDSLLQCVHGKFPDQVGTLQALAANAVTRHAFAEAEDYLHKAYALGENKYSSTLMLVDVLLERGYFDDAAYFLKGTETTTQFDHLIREMKLNDQRGNLPEAIVCMEKALALARGSGSKALLNWSLSNLADMYGHDGQIQKSYETYLEALASNPADLHSLKGIAWVAYSHDKNTAEARRILRFLQAIHPVPDYDLLLSEIAEYEQKETEATTYQEAFMKKAGNPAYGNMYKSYLCRLEATKTGRSKAALEIAGQEIAERPHPMSYNLLAWATFQNGDKKTALMIVQNHVLDRTEEPDALLCSGIIFRENGYKQAARKCLEAALDASYELGPVATIQIREELGKL